MWIQRSVQSGSFGFVLVCWEIVDLRKKKKRVVRIVGMDAMGVLEKGFEVKIWEIWMRERKGHSGHDGFGFGSFVYIFWVAQ